MRWPSTRGGVAAAAVVLVVLALLAGALIAAQRWWSGAGGSYAPATPLAHAVVDPPRSLFGQVLTATTSVMIDPRRIDPSTVQVVQVFKPFAVRSESRSVRRGIGRAQIVTETYEIQCIVRTCVPHGGTGRLRAGATVVQLQPARVTARRRDGSPTSLSVRWPPLGVQSRLTSDDLAFSTPELDAGFSPPPFDYRIRPGVLAWVSLALAGASVLLAGWLVAGAALADRTPLRRRRIPAHLSAVERALLLAEHAVDHEEIPESRKALERLAAVLRDEQHPAAADSAERLAWSEDAPSRAGLASLAERVRSNGG